MKFLNILCLSACILLRSQSDADDRYMIETVIVKDDFVVRSSGVIVQLNEKRTLGEKYSVLLSKLSDSTAKLNIDMIYEKRKLSHSFVLKIDEPDVLSSDIDWENLEESSLVKTDDWLLGAKVYLLSE